MLLDVCSFITQKILKSRWILWVFFCEIRRHVKLLHYRKGDFFFLNVFSPFLDNSLVTISPEEARKRTRITWHCGCARARTQKYPSQTGSTWTHLRQQQSGTSGSRGPFKNLLGAEKGSCFIESGAKWTRPIPRCRTHLCTFMGLKMSLFCCFRFKIDLLRCS